MKKGELKKAVYKYLDSLKSPQIIGGLVRRSAVRILKPCPLARTLSITPQYGKYD